MSTKKIVKAKKSKRITTHARVNTKKRVKEAKKRVHKEFKKMKKEGVAQPKKRSKELRIPNMHPFKKNMLEQLKRSRNGEQKAKNIEEQDVAAVRAELLDQAVLQIDCPTMQIEEETIDVPTNHPLSKKVRNNMKPIQHIFENADVLLEVLDARDPMGCRCHALEMQLIKEHPGKRLILVLNKIDLVPIDVVNKWREILSREYPTVVFKSNMQHQNTNLSTNHIFKKTLEENSESTKEILNSAKTLGAEKLIELLKNYSRVEGGKISKITVGVFGFPNVGKSSVINSLTRRKAASVSSTPGHTKSIQEIEIDSKVTLIDSPGVVASSEDEITLLLRNTIKADQVVDVSRAIEEILKRVTKEDLLKLYKTADFANNTEFLVNMALKMGKMKKGGIPNLEETARIVIRDWNEGKIKYYVAPPLLVKDLQSVVMKEE